MQKKYYMHLYEKTIKNCLNNSPYDLKDRDGVLTCNEIKYNLTQVVRCLYLCRRNHAVILNISCLKIYRVSQKKRTFRIVWDMCGDQIFWLFWLF